MGKNIVACQQKFTTTTDFYDLEKIKKTKISRTVCPEAKNNALFTIYENNNIDKFWAHNDIDPFNEDEPMFTIKTNLSDLPSLKIKKNISKKDVEQIPVSKLLANMYQAENENLQKTWVYNHDKLNFKPNFSLLTIQHKIDKMQMYDHKIEMAKYIVSMDFWMSCVAFGYLDNKIAERHSKLVKKVINKKLLIDKNTLVIKSEKVIEKYEESKKNLRKKNITAEDKKMYQSVVKSLVYITPENQKKLAKYALTLINCKYYLNDDGIAKYGEYMTNILYRKIEPEKVMDVLHNVMYCYLFELGNMLFELSSNFTLAKLKQYTLNLRIIDSVVSDDIINIYGLVNGQLYLEILFTALDTWSIAVFGYQFTFPKEPQKNYFGLYQQNCRLFDMVSLVYKIVNGTSQLQKYIQLIMCYLLEKVIQWPYFTNANAIKLKYYLTHLNSGVKEPLWQRSDQNYNFTKNLNDGLKHLLDCDNYVYDIPEFSKEVKEQITNINLTDYNNESMFLYSDQNAVKSFMKAENDVCEMDIEYLSCQSHDMSIFKKTYEIGSLNKSTTSKEILNKQSTSKSLTSVNKQSTLKEMQSNNKKKDSIDILEQDLSLSSDDEEEEGEIIQFKRKKSQKSEKSKKYKNEISNEFNSEKEKLQKKQKESKYLKQQKSISKQQQNNQQIKQIQPVNRPKQSFQPIQQNQSTQQISQSIQQNQSTQQISQLKEQNQLITSLTLNDKDYNIHLKDLSLAPIQQTPIRVV